MANFTAKNETYKFGKMVDRTVTTGEHIMLHKILLKN
jgi:hypothetical protein